MRCDRTGKEHVFLLKYVFLLDAQALVFSYLQDEDSSRNQSDLNDCVTSLIDNDVM